MCIRDRDAPSNLAVIGLYILTPNVLKNVGTLKKGACGEIQLTDAIAMELENGADVYGYRFDGQRYDCGSKSGFLQATIAFALARPELHDELMDFMVETVGQRRAAQ